MAFEPDSDERYRTCLECGADCPPEVSRQTGQSAPDLVRMSRARSARGRRPVRGVTLESLADVLDPLDLRQALILAIDRADRELRD